MSTDSHQALEEFFTTYAASPGIQELRNQWSVLTTTLQSVESASTRTTLYETAIALLDEIMWAEDCPETALDLYQRLNREMASWVAHGTDDERFEFVIVIPVADRPQHLEECLNSLLELCRRYACGGRSDGYYHKLLILIADDSREAHNIERQRESLERVAQQGLRTVYFGQSEQLRQLEHLGQARKLALSQVIGDNTADAFFHKGASITRNITYLRLAELASENPHRLFWFIDSDQEFQVNTQTGERNIYAINYLHHLNKIFSRTETQVLTGKVVGDPPVSPAVMAGNFLRDLSHFLSEMASKDPHQACRFHTEKILGEDDAAYHDMANLFGFESASSAFQYRCGLAPPHGHAACLSDFAAKLQRFFDGEHPTRRTRYEHQEITSSIQPARTVYTGNYVFRASALEYFIPFAALKLRMAGPTLGRLLKSELGPGFVSANLPMLHKRTVAGLGQSEFRPDVSRENDLVDLSGEYERQFYGDVMLFSIERLTEQGYPAVPLSEQTVRRTLQEVEATMRRKYTDIQALISSRLAALITLFEDSGHWWHQDPQHQVAVQDIRHFIRNMQHNFGKHAAGYRMIQSDSHRQQRLGEICQAILRLPAERKLWHETLSALYRSTAAPGAGS